MTYAICGYIIIKNAFFVSCYNESKTIAKVVNDYKTNLPEADIFVYDNNSSDGTDEIARKAGAIVRYEYKQGKGNVIRTMFREIEVVHVQVEAGAVGAEFLLGVLQQEGGLSYAPCALDADKPVVPVYLVHQSAADGSVGMLH